MPFIKMTSFSSSRADNNDDDAAAASFDYSGMAPRLLARSLAGNDTQKVGGQSTYISVADRSLPATAPWTLDGELLPRLRVSWRLLYPIFQAMFRLREFKLKGDRCTWPKSRFRRHR